MDVFAANAAIVRMSDVDFEFLYGGNDYAGRAKSLLAAGTNLVVVTRGIRGAQAWHRTAGAIEVQAPAVEVVDTIGAGEAGNWVQATRNPLGAGIRNENQ